MKTLAALMVLAGAVIPPSQPGVGQAQPPFPAFGTTQGYLTIHNVRPAHDLTEGAEAKVGILDHSFGRNAHPELYAGWEDFLTDPNEAETGSEESYHGYWMALTLHEIAPAADIFALDVTGPTEAETVEAIGRALDWAVEKGLDVVTYCSGTFSDEARKTLDPIIERTVEAGVVVVFVDYPHPLNLHPAGFEAPTGETPSSPDLNIFSYDCTAVLADTFVALMESDDNEIQRYRPFLAHPSTGSVTAGFVALLRSLDSDASPATIKDILMKTSRPMVVRGMEAQRVPDAYSAVTRLMGTGVRSH
jgi:hypothetical protein